MANKQLKVFDLDLTRLDIDEIEEKALQIIQQSAHQHYVSKDYSVAMAWVEAVLEYLKNRKDGK